MARRQRRDRGPFKLPAKLVPDLDDWGSEAEEEKRRLRNEWLRATDQADRYFFEWLPAYLAERRRLAGRPTPPPPRRRGPLPDRVKALLASMESGEDE
ncbi:MAG: hypothetical protein ACLFWH_05270 [Actinomycetota bacterium]